MVTAHGIRHVGESVALPADAAVAVFDVLRATTTIVTALAAGAAAVIPVGDVEEAISVRESWSDPGKPPVVAGERGGLPPAGFDLGNSPAAMTAQRVGGRTVVLSTTNGTRALLAAAHCRRVLVAALVNARATADALSDDPGPLVMLCAGSSGAPGIEDELAAGAVLDALARDTPLDLDPAAQGMHDLWLQTAPHDRASLLHASPAGRALHAVGLADDIDACARTDTIPLVAEFHNGHITRTYPSDRPF